jgi:hypothetical protein
MTEDRQYELKPRSVRENVLTQPMGVETLVYDERRHMAFCLNATSSAVWRLADGTRTMAEIAVVASLELGAPVSEELAYFAVEELRSDGLIEITARDEGQEHSARSGDAAARTVSRRAMLQRLGVGGAMLLPVVAAIVAPTAAQAYDGCVDCLVSPGHARPLRRR